METISYIKVFLKFLALLLTITVAIYSIYWYKLDRSILTLEPQQKRLQNEKDFASRKANGEEYNGISKKLDIITVKISREKYWRDKCVYLIRKYGVPLFILKTIIDYILTI